MAFLKFLKVAGAAAFPVVAVGDNATEAGFIITEDQANATEAALSAAETAAGTAAETIRTVTAERDNAVVAGKTAADEIATLKSNIAKITKERDDANALVKEYGGKTPEPKSTEKKEDEFTKPGAVVKDSFDQYAESMGVKRI